MSGEKNTRGRRHTRHEISRSGGSTIEELEYPQYSFENETTDQPKTSTTPAKRNRTRSESNTKIRSGGRHSEQVSDGSKDAEEVESDNLTYTKYDSESNKKNVIESPINSVRKVEDYLMRHDNPESDSPADNNQARKHNTVKNYVKQRKSKKKRKERSRASESKRTEHEEVYDDDEDGRATERRKSDESPENEHVGREKRRRSKKEEKRKTRISESNRTLVAEDLYEGDVRKKSKKLVSDEPRISKRRKRRRSNADISGRAERQEKELPITEILRQAQENSRNRYEEPVPLPELTTDTIYVQRRNGFSAVKITSDRKARGGRQSESSGLTLYPIKVAIAAQKVWNSTGLIYQGLLAGMALMHLLLIHTFFELHLDFLVSYSLIAEIYTNIFFFLVTMCVVSVLDKFDLAHLDLEHLREIYVDHSRSFLAVPLYMATFCLHQASLRVDDKISLLEYPGNATGFENNSTTNIIEEELVTWQKVTLAKDGLAVIAWLFVVLGPREDMLLTHLKSMEKYASTPELSHRDIVDTIRGNVEDR